MISVFIARLKYDLTIPLGPSTREVLKISNIYQNILFRILVIWMNCQKPRTRSSDKLRCIICNVNEYDAFQKSLNVKYDQDLHISTTGPLYISETKKTSKPESTSQNNSLMRNKIKEQLNLPPGTYHLAFEP